MHPARWKRVDNLFQSALSLPPQDRDAYLAAECAGDTELEREVRSLLACEQEAESFLERPAIEDETATLAVPSNSGNIGHYRMLEQLGSGGMGVVHKAEDVRLHRFVAIKFLGGNVTANADSLKRFRLEARAASALNHPNICTIYDVGEQDGKSYIVMEFLRGTPLGARMTSQPPLSTDDKLNIVAQLCDGLAYAHEQGVVHRDVKPDNVFILEDGSVKLLDFGIAKLTSSNLTRQGDVLGSASYMSPEQVGGSDSVDGRADVFANMQYGEGSDTWSANPLASAAVANECRQKYAANRNPTRSEIWRHRRTMAAGRHGFPPRVRNRWPAWCR